MNAQSKIEEARSMYSVAVGNRDAEMIRYWNQRLTELTTGK